jgi:hypothetical protein
MPAAVGGDPPDDVIVLVRAVGVLDRELGLADAAEAVWTSNSPFWAPSANAAHSSAVEDEDRSGVTPSLQETEMCAIWS